MPTTIAALMLLSAEVLGAASPFSSFLPGCSSPVLSAVRLSSSVIFAVNSMSSLN